MIDQQSLSILTRIKNISVSTTWMFFYPKSSKYCWVILSLIDNFPRFSLPMSYVSSGTNLTAISRLMPQVVLFENWKFLACCYFIIRYLNQFQRCGNRSFSNCIIFQTSLFCLYFRKIVNSVFNNAQKNILGKC